MMYFDTDVLVLFVVKQDPEKHKKAQALVEKAAFDRQFIISHLSLGEFAFVLAKLGVDPKIIDKNLDVFNSTFPKIINDVIFDRVREIANKIGYRYISDCLHTAIAESMNANLITCNKKDFRKIKRYTDLNITIF